MMMEPARPLRQGSWTESALRVLRERYLVRREDGTQETPEEMCWRVAQCIAGAETRYGRTPDQVKRLRDAFDIQCRNLAKIVAAGVKIAFATDAGFGLPARLARRALIRSMTFVSSGSAAATTSRPLSFSSIKALSATS